MPFPKKIELVTFPIPFLVESEEKGPFVQLTLEIAKRNKRDVRVRLQPIGKAYVDFSSHKYQGLFPAVDLGMPKDIFKSEAFYYKKDFIFFKRGRGLNSIKSLEDKKVGLTFRYIYSSDLMTNKKITFEYADDELVNMKKLGEGKIDAFVAEEASGLKAAQLSGYADIEFDKTKPLSEQPVYYGFQNTAEGKALNEMFSKTILAMKKDGSLERIFSQKDR